MSTTQVWKIGDCLELIKDIPDNSIDLIINDPPYYKIKSDGWDNQWKTFNDYLEWLEIRAVEMKRVLKDNGSLYMFGDDHRIAYIQVMLDKHFTFLNHLVWYKRNNVPIKYAHNFRRFAPTSERILFYSLQDATGLECIMSNNETFGTVKKYMRCEYQKVMSANGFKTKAECDLYLNEITNTKSVVTRHYFADSQYCFPTLELYTLLQTSGFFNREYEDLRREYEDLRREYEDLRRPFNYTKGMYEVFDIPIINGKENTTHSTTKPIEVITRLIKTSTTEGANVLDMFGGSGTTLEACMNTNRNCLLFELSDEWEPHYKKRLRLNETKLSKWDNYINKSTT